MAAFPSCLPQNVSPTETRSTKGTSKLIRHLQREADGAYNWYFLFLLYEGSSEERGTQPGWVDSNQWPIVSGVSGWNVVPPEVLVARTRPGNHPVSCPPLVMAQLERSTRRRKAANPRDQNKIESAISATFGRNFKTLGANSSTSCDGRCRCRCQCRSRGGPLP